MKDQPDDNLERWIGVDVGTARVGIAVTDESVSMALPHATVAAADAIEEILDLVESHSAGVVVGWPLQMNGTRGRATKRVEVFLEGLSERAEERSIDLTVEKRDERLTTGLAEALLAQAGIRGKRKKQVVDQVAAVEILKAFLQERKHGEEE